MEDALIYIVFTFSMFCVVAYFAIPAIKKLKENRHSAANDDAQTARPETEELERAADDEFKDGEG